MKKAEKKYEDMSRYMQILNGGDSYIDIALRKWKRRLGKYQPKAQPKPKPIKDW